jgi:hypothetical protein
MSPEARALNLAASLDRVKSISLDSLPSLSTLDLHPWSLAFSLLEACLRLKQYLLLKCIDNASAFNDSSKRDSKSNSSSSSSPASSSSKLIRRLDVKLPLLSDFAAETKLTELQSLLQSQSPFKIISKLPTVEVCHFA